MENFDLSQSTYYIFAIAFSLLTTLIAYSAFRMGKRSAKNSGRSATQAERANANKYKVLLHSKFELKEYSDIDQAYRSTVTIQNSGEVTITVKVHYEGTVEFLESDNSYKVDTIKHTAVIKPGESAPINIDIITGGIGGRAKLQIHCLATNTQGNSLLILGSINEILRAPKAC
ncbi:hypothetical protein ACIPZ8_14775 [Pseudomonas sp. NPDC089422]|uniref:hypothetical protein n=1 Tax=Pseudomonas sp. NPDC089422 TaxID=3364466 RepID=UPI0038239911